jgi:hypothetical protein
MEPEKNKTIQLIQEIRLHLQSLKEPIDADGEEASYFRKKLSRHPLPSSPLVPLPLPAVKTAPPPIEPLIELAPLPLPISPPPVKAAPLPFPVKPSPPPTTTPTFSPRLPPLSSPSIEAKPLPFQKLKALLQKIAPSLPILPEPPSDAFAKKIHTRWKTKNQIAPITLLSFQEPPEQKALLQEIVKALDVYFGPARLVEAGPIEKEQQWEALLSVPELRWILCCDYTLWQLPKLLSLFKEIPAQQIKTIGSKPLFLFPDLSLYLKDPLLKRSLWKALETALGKEP